MDIRQRLSRCSAGFNGLRVLASFFSFLFLAATSNHTSGSDDVWLSNFHVRLLIIWASDSFLKGTRFIKKGLHDNGKRRILPDAWFDVAEK